MQVSAERQKSILEAMVKDQEPILVNMQDGTCAKVPIEEFKKMIRSSHVVAQGVNLEFSDEAWNAMQKMEKISTSSLD